MPAPDLDELADHLAVLASRPRLDILQELRRPRRLADIRVTPALHRGEGSEERAASRQAVRKHLDVLIEAGLVRRKEGPEGDVYVGAHDRLFALVDDLRGLSRMRPYQDPDEAPTMLGGAAEAPELPEGPRLVIAYGRDDGAALALRGGIGKEWTIGRATSCDLSMDYDPFVSARHAVVERGLDGFHLTDAKSRNGTTVNSRPITRARLRGGDIIGVGRSLLVFQP